MISEEACLAINILQLEPVEGEESSKSRRIQGRVCLPLNLRSSLSRGRIKLTLQQATTYASAILFLDRSGGREKWREAADDASPPPHISYTLLHFLNMTRPAPRDSTRSWCFHTPLVEGCRASLRGRRGSKVCGPSTILYAKFHGSRKRNSESASKWSSPWKITRGISGPSFIHPYGHACSAPRFISSEQFIFPDYRVSGEF